VIKTLLKLLLAIAPLLAHISLPALAAAPGQPTVRVEPIHLQGPRPLAEQTSTAVVRDYLEAWQAMRAAMESNQAAPLDAYFVGSARDKLGDTIDEQTGSGLRTRYRDRAHEIQIVFYSPEGLSIQLVDTVDYDVDVLDHDKVQTTQHEHARYVVVMTPTEVRWRVRVFQADSK
jgi:hypothetical protein